MKQTRGRTHANKMLEEFKAPIDRLYFLDPDQTAPTLRMFGGLKCRSKLQGIVDCQRSPVVLTPSPVASLLQLSLFSDLKQ